MGPGVATPRRDAGGKPLPRRTSQPTDPAAYNRLEAIWWLKLVILLAAALPLAFFAAAASVDYQSIFSSAQRRSQRAGQIAHEHASRDFEMNEVISRQVLHNLASGNDTQIRAREAVLHGQLKNLTDGLAHIQEITVWNADGKLLVSSRAFPAPALDIPDREHFYFHRTHRDQLFVSEVQQSRVNGEPCINLSTRRNLSDGSFGGIVSTAVSPRHFTDFFRTLEAAEPGLSITLVREDGHLLAAWPPASGGGDTLDPAGVLMKALSTGAPEAMLDARATVDGHQRIGAYRKVGSLPLYIVSGIEQREVVAAWRRKTLLLAAFSLPASLALGFVSWIALRRTRRGLLAAERLKRESEYRSRAEAALRQAQKLEALGQLTGGVAHDFNNLLMVVDSNLQLLARLVPQTAGTPQVAAIDRAVMGGTRLTRQLLAFSRRQAVMPQVISINDAVPAMLDLLRTSLGSSIRLQFVAHTRPAIVRVDAAEFELALLNLAINARDAMQTGGDLTIATTSTSLASGSTDLRPGEYVVVTVTDTGPGVPEPLLARVFEPFFTTKKAGQGTGLGLSQVYGFCLQAGGVARMASKPHAGTVVSLYLPAVAAPVQAAPAFEPTPDNPLRGRLLLVEDNQDVAAAIKPLLESLGCEVVHVPSADAALRALGTRTRRFDVVLSDILMPGSLNGLDLAMRLRHQTPDLPVLLMTGYAEQTGQAMAAGFQILAKPVSAGSLAKAIGAALQVGRAGATALS